MGSTPRGISASRAAAILGLGEYEGQTPFTVWQLICEERRPGFNAERGYTMPEPPDNAAIRFGTAFEDAIVELASAEVGITDREMLFIADELDFVTCHIDGRYATGALHEGKTTNLWTHRELWGEPGSDRVPSGYQVQGQHQMLCTGAEEDIFSVLVFPRRPDEWEKEGIITPSGDLTKGRLWKVGANEEEGFMPHGFISDWARVIAEMGLFFQYPVEAKAELQGEMVERYRAFWSDYVIAEREPPIDCYSDFKRAFPTPKGTIIADEQVERWASEWKMIAEEIGDSGSMARRREELKMLMLSYMRSHDSMIDDDSREKTVLVDSQGRKLAQFNGKVFR